jgi:hypothetical protein
MTIKSLKDTLNGLPTDYDDYEILFCKSIDDDGNRTLSFEEPVYGSMMLDDRNVYLLLSKKSMEYMDEKNPEVELDTKGEWIEGSF